MGEQRYVHSADGGRSTCARLREQIEEQPDSPRYLTTVAASATALRNPLDRQNFSQV